MNKEELIALAKENGVEIAPEKAEELFEQMNANGELSDDALDKVAGGNNEDVIRDWFRQYLNL